VARNLSKTAVMYVIGFTYLSLGSSTVHLQTVSVADTHVQFQRLVSVVKMATLLEECTTEEQRSVVRFFVGKRT
jgi:hypothetical protein